MSKDMKYSEVREIVHARYCGRCAICRQEVPLGEMCINLITPKSKGGHKEFSNMQAVCEHCGKMKHNMAQEEFMMHVARIAMRNMPGIAGAYIRAALGRLRARLGNQE